MNRFNKLSHTIYECKYHIVFCPKYQYRIFKDSIGEYTRQQIYRLCSQKELVEVIGVECPGRSCTCGSFDSTEVFDE